MHALSRLGLTASAFALAAAYPDLTPRDYGACGGGVSGTCQKTSQHCDNPYNPGNLCPGDETVQCCPSSASSAPQNYGVCSGITGVCQKTSQHCDSPYNSGNHCPGDESIQCCPSSAPSTYGACGGGVAGTCQKTSQPCANSYNPGNLCPGDESIQCCPSPSSSSTQPPVVHHDSPGLVDPPGGCVSPVRDTCDFYPTCLESKYHCGSSGYPIGYGLKYCNAFTAAKARFDDKGDKWVSDTMLCLQNALVQYALAQPPLISCDELKEKAIASHPDCYVNSGVCTLGPADWEIIVTTVDLKDLFGSIDNLKAVLQTLGDCVEFYEWLIEQGIIKVLDEIGDAAKDVWHKLTDWI